MQREKRKVRTLLKRIILGIPLLILLINSNAYGDWYNSNWLYRVKITVSSSQVSGDLVNFPVYLDLSILPANFFSHVKSDGSDIVITSSDGITKLPRELVSINTVAHTGELYFRAPTLSSSSDTDFYIYYGNSSANESNDASVWSNYVGVWHLNENVPSASYSLGIATQAAMDGGDGSWAVLFGSNPISGTTLNLAVDEDQISDTERSHTHEQVGYWVFSSSTAFDIKDSGGTIIGEVG